nr:hypothetical protein GCM10025730_04730 [Promicromonospora thailandica]
MTHDLLRDVLGAVGVTLERVEIVALEGGIYFAELVLSNGVHLDSRASDAIALAVRTGSPVLCSAEIVALAGVEIVDVDQQAEVERFRDFLDHVTPEDFLGPPGGGAPAADATADARPASAGHLATRRDVSRRASLKSPSTRHSVATTPQEAQ